MKRYRCTFCKKMIERNNMSLHIIENHNELIPENFTASRLAFSILNKKDKGYCVECKSETNWSEDKKRYERFCSDKCKVEAGKRAKDNMKKIYNKEHLLDDPNVQIKMLKNRRISGVYKFSNGDEKEYVGKLEKSFLEYLDKVVKLDSSDIITDYPIIEYQHDNRTRTYIPDFYIPIYNLIIEVKDGGNNKNTNPQMKETREKTKAKEDAIIKLNKYNYLRLTDNNFSQFIECISVIKNNMDNDEHVFIINETHHNNIRGFING